jgi:hypothetical protein
MHTPLFRLPSFDLPPSRMPMPAEPEADEACGWYASSYELRRGLQVTELADLRLVARELALAPPAAA